MKLTELKEQFENVALAMVALVHPSTIDKFAMKQLKKSRQENKPT